MDMLVIILPLALIGASLWFFPVWNVWRKRRTGEGDLARAQYEQRIQVAEAEGRLLAAQKNKEAAIIEAEAVAAQIERIGKELQSHDLYLRWQWIRMMEIREREGIGETIYVPTEANLPVLEATRFRVQQEQKTD